MKKIFFNSFNEMFLKIKKKTKIIKKMIIELFILLSGIAKLSNTARNDIIIIPSIHISVIFFLDDLKKIILPIA